MVFEEVEVKVLERTPRTLELEIKGEGHTLCNLLVDFLNRHPDVEYASYTIEHPLIGVPRLFIKTKTQDPLKILFETLDELEEILSKLQEKAEEELAETA
ncbi:MAG: hypothetical protein DRJ51_06770 [Thermoprotei archaeon]|nr:MAG: hypothetical protein DRJ51_06770 [Thermoprotei archaeon]RLF02619.1 MAG: hypothetical protein DRJ59_03095 [Thermoprotei archaeon]